MPDKNTDEFLRLFAAVELGDLASQTGGDETLALDVLRLFAGQARATAAALRDAGDDARRSASAHRLCGAARAIGARALARLATRVEIEPSAGDAEALAREAEDIAVLIERYLGLDLQPAHSGSTIDGAL